MQDSKQIAEPKVCEQCVIGNTTDENRNGYCAEKAEKTIILYSTGCPRCIVLEKKLSKFGIEYAKNTDVSVMTALGIKSAPALQIDGELLDFSAANEWLNKLKQEGTA